MTDDADELLEALVLSLEFRGHLFALELVTHPATHQIDERHVPLGELFGACVRPVETERAVHAIVIVHRGSEITGDAPVGIAGAVGLLRRVLCDVPPCKGLSPGRHEFAVRRLERYCLPRLEAVVVRSDDFEQVLFAPNLGE